MADPSPVISDMVRLDQQERPQVHDIARFSCLTGGVLIMGLRLARNPDGSLRLRNAARKGGVHQAVRGAVIQDEALKAAILAAATIALDATPPLPAPAAITTDRKRRGRRAAPTEWLSPSWRIPAAC